MQKEIGELIKQAYTALDIAGDSVSGKQTKAQDSMEKTINKLAEINYTPFIDIETEK